MAVEIFRGYVKTFNKKPVQKFKDIEDLPTLEDVSKYEEYAGILNDQYTVMDVDDSIEAQKTYELVCDLDLNCRVIKTTRGMHFVFKKNQYANKGNTHQLNALGFTFDIRTGVNQYIVVKKDKKIREILRDFDETKPITDYPKFFAPIKNGKSFTGFKEGDGRNGALFSHIATLFHNGFDKKEIKKICNWINDYAFDESLSISELQTILRDESFSELKRSSAEEEFGVVGLKPNDFSDVAMAELFKEHYEEEIRYNPGLGWLVWNGKKWEPSKLKAQRKYIDFLNKVKGHAKQLVKEAYNTDDEKKIKEANKFYQYVLKMSDSSKINGVLNIAQSLLEIDAVELDAYAFELNTPDGIINLRTGEIKPHDPQRFCTKMTISGPNDEGKDLFEDLLNTITQNDESLKKYLQVICGVGLIGKVYNEALIIAHGSGANGKSTLFNTYSRVLGDYSGKFAAEALMRNAQNTKNALAELVGKRFILISETEEGEKMSSSILKKISSSDPIKAEKKYKDPFEFEPSHQALLYTNFLPKLASLDNGTKRRIIICPFNAQIDNPIKDLAEQLQDKSSGAIIKWAVEGAKIFIENGYSIPTCSTVEEAKNKYFNDNDWLKTFLDDCCVVDKLEKVQGGVLYKAYRQWCQDVGEFAKRSKDFTTALETFGFSSKRSNKGVMWSGLSLSPDRTVGKVVEDDFL